MRAVTGVIAAVWMAGCVAVAPPVPAGLRDSPPPWPAPRDAVSWIEAAGLPKLPLNDTSDPYVITLRVVRNGAEVEVAPHIGVDRVRAWQAPVHTHDASGEVWLEGQGNRTVTLGEFFAVWGVRFTDACLGDVCGRLEVRADGVVVADPVALVLRSVRREVTVSVTG